MNHERLFSVLHAHSMDDWSNLLEQQLKDYFTGIKHGDYPKWQAAIDELPQLSPSISKLNSESIIIGDAADCTTEEFQLIQQQLKVLMPWRKGPFNLFGVFIDTEWQSNIKWARLSGHIKPLKDRLVLDIGCGNGYYGWRMLGQDAKYVVGLDPTLLFLMQFSVFKRYLPEANIDILPFGIQALPDYDLGFDTVFSMGVIYHRRDPIEHLIQLKNCLKPSGELVLETLIIESSNIDKLVPEGRYAKMKNVWAIPTSETLIGWVNEAGFKNARIIDISKTTNGEQRKTDWMEFESLADFLDKEDNAKTVEGYPAPKRAILLAEN